MVNFTASTEQNETSGSKKSASNEPSRQATLPWTLQRLNRTWFISPLDEHIVLVEHPVSNGATDAQWMALIRTTGVRIQSKDDAKPWGPMARRDFLNMVENTCPERMPQFFDTKEVAAQWLKERNEHETSSINEEETEEGTAECSHVLQRDGAGTIGWS
jgi:hypothetical protein